MTNRRPIKADDEMVLAARRLRKEATNAEKILWQALRGSQLYGLKFRRQHPVGPYILDFYCVSKQLAIELDGSVHEQADQQRHDQDRTEYLDNLGITILRFKNDQVENQLPRVISEIKMWIEQHS